MNNNYFFEKTTQGFTDILDDKYVESDDSMFFSIGINQKFDFFDKLNNQHSENIFELIQEITTKEAFYIKAINNLLRQKEYINLMYQFQTKQISSDEFSDELNTNENKYLIKIDQKLSIDNYKVISEIIKKIDFGFSEDDISEVFSIRTQCINQFLIEDKDI